MSELFDEYGLEEEPLPPEPSFTPEKKKTVEKKKGGWLGRIISLLLGTVIGVGACVGGVYYAADKVPVQSLIGLFPIDYETKVKDKILGADYGGKTIVEIAMALKDAVTNDKKKTLSDLDAIFPILGDQAENLSGTVKENVGITLNTTEMFSKPFGELPAYLTDTVTGTPLADILKAQDSDGKLDPMLMEICYGEENIDYTYAETDKNKENPILRDGLTPVTIASLIDDPISSVERVSVASVAKPDISDTVMLAICYGQQDVTYKIVPDLETADPNDEKVEMQQLFLLKDEDGNFIDHNDFPLVGEVETLENNDNFLKVTQYRTNADHEAITDDEGNPKVKYVYYIKNTPNEEGKYLAYQTPEDGAKEALFLATKIMDMQDDSQDIIGAVTLADALNVYPHPTDPEKDPHALMFSLAYGLKDEDYEIWFNPETNQREVRMLHGSMPNTIADLKNRNTELINDVLLSDIMGEDRDDAVIMYMLYGKKDIHYTIDPDTDKIKMLPKRIAILEETVEENTVYYVYNEYGELLQARSGEDKGYILTPNSDQTYTYTDAADAVFTCVTPDPALVPPTMTTARGEATIYYLRNEYDEIENFHKSTMADLAGSDNLVARLSARLTIAEILGEENVEENTFLKHVADSTVDELPDAIQNLTFGQVFEQDMYLTDDGNYVDKNGNIVSEENRVLMGEWKYLLKDEDGNINTDYKISSDMDKLLENMTRNVQNAPLNDLKEDGIMDFDDEMLNTDIRTGFTIGDHTELIDFTAPTGKTKLGDLTTLEMLDYLTATLNVMNKFDPQD